MLRFLISRVIQGIAVILGVLCITFLLLRLAPGGPYQGERDVPEHIRRQQEVMYGMDKPVPVQLWNHIVSFATFNFPPSPKTPGRGVEEIIAQGFIIISVKIPQSIDFQEFRIFQVKTVQVAKIFIMNELIHLVAV